MLKFLKFKSTEFKKMQTWAKKNLFSSPLNTITTVVIGILIFKLSASLFSWLVLESVFWGSAADCAKANGACLSFIRERWLFLFFGFYPEGSLFRPFLAIGLLFGFLFYFKDPKRWNHWFLLSWLAFVLVEFWILRGGLGLEIVPAHKWGGLLLTLVVSFLAITLAYPWGIILALGRTSKMPLIKSLSVAYIELIRGVPLISVLFMSSVMLPLFMPEGLVIPKLLRAIIAFVLFMGAYMAEVVRGGLNSVPKGQFEASMALGLNTFQMLFLVILPQALRLVIPPTINVIIALFKDTSLILIIALFDFLMVIKSSLEDPEWLGFSTEGYLFAAVIYFIFCFTMSQYSKKLETLNRTS